MSVGKGVCGCVHACVHVCKHSCVHLSVCTMCMHTCMRGCVGVTILVKVHPIQISYACIRFVVMILYIPDGRIVVPLATYKSVGCLESVVTFYIVIHFIHRNNMPSSTMLCVTTSHVGTHQLWLTSCKCTLGNLAKGVPRRL